MSQEHETARAIIKTIEQFRTGIEIEANTLTQQLENLLNLNSLPSVQEATINLINQRLYAIDQLTNVIKDIENTFTDGIPF